MPVSRDEWPSVVSAIRAVHSDVPILILGGHTHIRDCTTYDAHSVGLESGRYLETIGWLSANLTQPGAATDSNQNLTFSRSYIDANRRNFAFHAGLTDPSHLDTKKGTHITAAMAQIASDWNLTQRYGVAPQDYYLDRVGIESNHSILNLLSTQILPTVVSSSNPDRKGKPNIILANSGAQRFDLYAGNFTKNDNYIVSPFTDAFLYLQDVPYKYANQVLGKLNRRGAYSKKRRDDVGINNRRRQEREAYEKGHVDDIYRRWRQDQFTLQQQREQQQQQSDAARDLQELDARVDAIKAASAANDTQPTLGYVTKDSCPDTDTADDTVHTAIPYASTPDYIASPVAGNSTAVQDSDVIDVVFVDFIVGDVVSILNSLQSDKTYSKADAKSWGTLMTNDVFVEWAKLKWQS